MATILNGRAIAAQILEAVRKESSALGRVPIARAVVVGPTSVTESYMRIKRRAADSAGMRLEIVTLPEDVSVGTMEQAIREEGADAVIVQLPIPDRLHETLGAIPLAKDADVLSPQAYERFVSYRKDALVPPVVAAVAELFAHGNVQVPGKKAVVVGGGRLVGNPVSVWLGREGADVTVLTQGTFEARKDVLKEADIVVAGAGQPRLITPDLLKEGAVLIDAGTSESGGAIVGDFDPACADIASVFTPVPGGVGPVAVASLFRNVLALVSSDNVH